jgi:hypothetical protein
MPKLPIAFETRIAQIPEHSIPLAQEAEVPRQHYTRSANDAWNLLVYVQTNLAEADIYQAPYERHFHRLSTMVMLGIIEAFERFLKEISAVCVNHVAPLTIDGRFDVFSIRGSSLAAHFAGANLGRALCETLTWCNCDDTNDRLRRVLASPFSHGDFYVFPGKSQNPAALRNRYELASIIWQLRHTIAHNMGVITASDALKFKLLARREITSARLLWPSKGDVWYVKLFVDETVELINEEVARRLAELMTELHAADNSLFEPVAKAQELANAFRVPCEIAGHVCNPV